MVDLVTLRLDPASQARFDTLRQRHFPPERNHIAAHITLFHSLPAEPWISAELDAVASRHTAFPVPVTGVRSLGKGVAYRLASCTLQQVHAELTGSFADELIPQDRQRLQPHIVVQNKVTPAAAKLLLNELERTFKPWTTTAVGLDLWHYLGGPWQHVRTFPFRDA